MGCGCKKAKPLSSTLPQKTIASLATTNRVAKLVTTDVETKMNDDNFAMIEYVHGNRGQHRVYGATTKTFYGYRGGGEKFLVHKSDIAAQPQLFRVIAVETKPAPRKAPAAPSPTPIIKEEKKPEVIEKVIHEARFDLGVLPGVTPSLVKKLKYAGLDSAEAILAGGEDALENINGIGATKAKMIYAYVKERNG